MSRTITLIAAVGTALVVALPAYGKGQPVEPQWMQALDARSQELNRQHGLGEYSPAIRALKLRSEALNQQHGLGSYASTATNAIEARERSMSVGRDEQPTSALDARERAFVAKRIAQLSGGTPPDAFERAVTARGTGSGEVQLSSGTPPDAFERAVAARGTGSVDYFTANDNRFRVTPVNDPVTVSATGSGDEIEWPQIGIGLGIGIALMLGLVLVLRATRQSPLAH